MDSSDAIKNVVSHEYDAEIDQLFETTTKLPVEIGRYWGNVVKAIVATIPPSPDRCAVISAIFRAAGFK